MFIFQISVHDRETEVTEVLENFTNLEKECEGAKQPVSVELQVNMVSSSEDIIQFLLKHLISLHILCII
jgi:hypothetical protein